jgi:hypothetical protein
MTFALSRYTLGPRQNFLERNADGPEAHTHPETCLDCRSIASSTGCAAVAIYGGLRGPQNGSCKPTHSTKYGTRAFFETIPSERTLQLSRRSLWTLWM